MRRLDCGAYWRIVVQCLRAQHCIASTANAVCKADLLGSLQGTLLGAEGLL